MSIIRGTILASLALGASLASSGLVNAANLLTDGSFESAPLGTTTSGSIGDGAGGWSVTSTGTNILGLIVAGTAATGQTYFGATLPADPLTSGLAQAAGTHVAYFAGDTETDTLTQTITLTAGTTYQVGFDITPTFTGGSNPGLATISAKFGSTLLFSTTTAGLSTPTTETDNSTWTHFDFNFTPTSGGAATFGFAFSTNQSPSQDVLIDRVYVATAAEIPGSVPEPASLVVAASGLISLGVFCLARRHTSALAAP